MFPGKSQSRLIFCGPPVFRWLSLTGTVEVLETPEARERIWREGDEQYYPPQGIADPDYCVLRFTAQGGQYYSRFKSEDFTL